MSKEAQKRAAEVAELPHVQAWIKRFQKVAKDMPEELWVYVAAGMPNIMAHSPSGKPYMRPNYGTDPDGTVAYVLTGSGRWDGGDW